MSGKDLNCVSTWEMNSSLGVQRPLEDRYYIQGMLNSDALFLATGWAGIGREKRVRFLNGRCKKE